MIGSHKEDPLRSLPHTMPHHGFQSTCTQKRIMHEKYKNILIGHAAYLMPQ